jgi:pimeloyl-ACP methyl ester carboxylesterase
VNRANLHFALLLMTIGSFFATLAGCAHLTPYEDAVAKLPTENFLTFRGRKIYVEEHGSGPTLLLLHGFAASSFSFHKLVPRLAGHFRVVALDYYGFGYTQRPKKADEFGIDAQLALIRHVMDAKRMSRATVLGQSFGGTLALLLAQSDPQLVERLVLISAVTEFGDPPAWVRSPVLRWAGYPATRLLLSSPKRFREIQRRAYHRESVLTAEMAEAYRERLMIEGLKETYFAFTEDMARGESPALELARVKLPVLVIAGRHDRIVPPASAQRLVAALPSARLLMLEESAHSAPEEEPEAVARAIRAFAGEPGVVLDWHSDQPDA